MRNDAHEPAVVAGQVVKDIHRKAEALVIKSAEAFIDEERIEGLAAEMILCKLRQTKREGEGCQEFLAARK